MDEQGNLGNGQSDKMESADVKVEEMDSTSAADGEQAKLEKGAKRKSKGGGPSPKKKRVLSAVQQKNPLMQLNELKPGLTYKVESQSGPPHNPEFVVSVDVNGQKYIGRGNSKQLAKHAAAQAALASIVQFRNTPGPMTMMNVDPNAMVDFTKDNVENEGCNFNKFEVRKNGDEEEVLISTGAPALKPHPMKILNEADKKNPVMLLNEIHPGLEYHLKEENSSIPSQRFRMTVKVNGESYEGTGQNKKLAKTAAARAVLCHLYNVSYSMYKDVFAQSTSDADLFSFPQAVADKISNQLMSTFSDVMVGIQDYAKWKVIAGIAMTKDESMEDSQIISFGTGTKCINGEHISMVGANINDCHAEIISRRCLKDFFYTNLELLIEGEGDESIFEKRDGGGFRLKPHIKFHLYISTAPCGDARIFAPHEECIGDAVDRHPNRNSRGVLRTKIESGEGTIPVKGGQCIQTWDSILPGQERLLTMSCSDKIASWNVLGLQGALLSHFVEPIYLDSIILGGLFHPNHLRRALFGRIENHIKDLPEHFCVNKPKMCSTTSSVVRHVSKSPSFSVNWTLGLGRAEVINAVNGKTEGGQVSRLSKRSFFQRFINIYDKLSHIDTHATPKPPLYGVFKSAMKSYREAQKSLTAAFVAAGLGHWVKKPIEQNEFEHA